MSESPFLLAGFPSSDHLRVPVQGRMHSRGTDFRDGNWPNTGLAIRARAFRATISAGLRVRELAAFRRRRERLYDDLGGEAVLESMETWIALRLAGNGRGHVAVAGEIMDARGWEPGSHSRSRRWTRRNRRR